MPNSWIDFVKAYASENGLTYRAALATKGLNDQYKQSKPTKEVKAEPMPEPKVEPMAEPMAKIKKPRKSKKVAEEIKL
jgi:hypothetical protein